MCGIVGYFDAGRPISEQLLCTMRDRLAHRGPDDTGAWISADGRAALGHRRLSIVDLSPTGHQPMFSPDGRFVIVLNGEIYNFRELRAGLEKDHFSFVGTSDTEVILAAHRKWGPACLDYFVGQFAFAIYDTLERTVFAARDRAGEKPFFYRHDGRRFVFASELKALLAHPDMPRKVSPEGLNNYLAFGYVPRDGCILEGYSKLSAGHQVTFEMDTGRLAVGPYWLLPPPPQGAAPPAEEQADKLATLLSDSLRGQLMADVPVGILLSGGLDSSLVAASAARTSGTRLKTYSIGFPGHGPFDETEHAKLVADYLGTDHMLLPADDETIDILPRLVAQFDEPIADSSMVPTCMVSQLARQHCTVALGGDGGDELFGGYLHYGRVDRVRRLQQCLPGRMGFDHLLSAAIPMSTRGRAYLLSVTGRFPAEVTLNRYLDPDLRRKVLEGEWNADKYGPEKLRESLVGDRQGAFNRLSALDFKAYMCDDILVKVDRASMLNALEVRAPFLDHRIIEFAFGEVPQANKIGKGERKRLLRILAKRLLPPEFDVSRKQGFSIPLDKWLHGRWKPLVDDLLEGGSPFFNKLQLHRMLSRWRQNEIRGANLVFQLTILEAWRRHFGVQV